MTTSIPSFTSRHVALARALFAAIATIMITFTSDHSAAVGLSTFSGFVIATGLVWALSAWLVYGAGQRVAPIVMAAVSIITGIIAGMPPFRTPVMFVVLVAVWALVTGLAELLWGVNRRKAGDRAFARDALTMGVITLVLAAVTIVVPLGYELPYYVEEAKQWFTLTGTTIAVGIFGGYAAIVAVFQALAGFTPARAGERGAVDATPEEATR